MLIQKAFQTSHEKVAASDAALAVINAKFAVEPVTADDVFIGRMKLANTRVDRSHEKFPVEYLQRFAETLPGKAVLIGHDKSQAPRGRFYAAEVAKAEDGEHELYASYYVDAADPLSRQIKSGIAKDVSIGFYASKRFCGICGGEYDPMAGVTSHAADAGEEKRPKKPSASDTQSCSHRAGRTYGSKLCTVTYGGDVKQVEAIEGSWVWLGCQVGAQSVSMGAKAALPGAGLVVEPNEEEPAEPAEPKGQAMEELEKALAELAEAKAQIEKLTAEAAEREPLVKAGESYVKHLVTEVSRKYASCEMAEVGKAIVETLAGNIVALQHADDAAQKLFDARFPPAGQGQVSEQNQSQQSAKSDFNPLARARRI